MKAVPAGHLAIVLGTLMAIGPLAIDTYLPALPAMAATLSAPVERVEASVALYLIGAALGQLVGGQLSDRYGRHRIAYGGLLLFALASLGIALAQDIGQLFALRLLQALGGGASVVIASASVRDFYTGREAARVLTSIGLVMLVAPLIAPALGALILHLSDWRSIFVVLALYALLMIPILRLALPQQRLLHARPQGGVLAAYARVLKHRFAMAYILTNAFAFAAMFVFITDSAFLYMEYFGASSNLFPVLFGANVVLMIGLNRLNILLLKRYNSPRMLVAGLALQGGATLLLLLLVLSDKLTLALTIPLVMLATGAVALITPNAMASFQAFFDADAGAATGINGALQFLLAGLAGTLVTAFHNSSAVPMTVTMFGCSLIAILVFLGLSRGSGEEL